MDERDRAEEDLRVIRTLMERATIYRAISAPTALLGGVLAIALAAFIWVREHHWAERAPEVMRHISTRSFASLWLGALAILLALNTFFVWRKAQHDGRPFISPAMKLALRSILPCLILPAATTIWFFYDGYEFDNELLLVRVFFDDSCGNDARIAAVGILRHTAGSQSGDGCHFRSLPSDLCGVRLELAGAAWQRMKNARFRQTRQSDSRERSAFHHDLAGDADGVVVSGSQSRAQYERWQSHHSSADFAQTGNGGGDERNSRSSANELCPDGEGAFGFQRISAGARTNCESGEKMITFVMSSGEGNQKFWRVTL